MTSRPAVVSLLAAAAVGLLTSCSTNVTSLEIGQCVNDLAPVAPGEEATEVASLPVVDCAEPHVGEVYALHELPEGDFPGVEAVQTSADELCTGPAFTDYVGVPYEESEVYSTSLHPVEEGWAFGDREIACLLGTEDGSPTTGSLRGANR